MEDLVQSTTSLWRFWSSPLAGVAVRGLIAEAQATNEALGALSHRFLPERTADVRQMMLDAAARGEIPTEEVGDKVFLWVGYSWLRLPVRELDHEDGIRAVMQQIAGVRS